jgi:hypothetical protein
VVAILVAGSTACGTTSPICEQGRFDVCTSCALDKDCESASARGEVCAPDEQCWPTSVLQTVTVTWTIGGQPANATTCATLPAELVVSFDDLGLMPDGIRTPLLPCTAGMAVQDEVPPNLTKIAIVTGTQLLGQHDQGGTTVTIDLPTSLDGFACSHDDDCAPDVCSIVRTCQPASKVEMVHLTWTVNGQPASAASCASVPNITLVLSGANPADSFYAPIKCADGVFDASAVPTFLTTVTAYDTSSRSIATATLVNGAATLDLMP